MATRLSADAEYPEHNERGQFVRLVGSTVLALGVAFGAWQASVHRDGASTPPAAVHAGAASTAVAPPAGRTVDARTTPAKYYAADPPAPVILLVGSAGEAARLTDALQHGEQILAGIGRPSFTAQVVIVASSEEADSFAQAMADADTIRAGLGLPPLEVHDLRTP